MQEIFKKIGFAIVVVALTAAFYWLIFMDRQEKQDALDYTMDVLGEKLMAMIPDNAEKDSVEAIYDDFIKETQARNVSPEAVERVAANIINLTNLDTVITPQQAKAMLEISFATPIAIAPPPEVPTETKPRKPLYAPSPQEWDELNKRIKTIYKFNKSFHEKMRTQQKHLKRSRPRIRVERDLHMVIDPEIKQQMESMEQQNEWRELGKEMRRLDAQRRIEWRKQARADWKKEMEAAQKELQAVHIELAALENDSTVVAIEIQKAMEAIKCLEDLPIPPAIPHPESLEALIKIQVKEFESAAPESIVIIDN